MCNVTSALLSKLRNLGAMVIVTSCKVLLQTSGASDYLLTFIGSKPGSAKIPSETVLTVSLTKGVSVVNML